MITSKSRKVRGPLRKLLFFLQLICITVLSNIVYGQGDFDITTLIFEPVLLTQVDPEDDGVFLSSGPVEAAGDLIEQSLSRTLDISQYEQAVQELEFIQGPYAVGLAEQLDSLGRIYQESGDHLAAIDFFERSKHITRVNQGLFSLEQLLVEENIIASYQALGDTKTVDELQEYIFYIKRKNYSEGDPEMIALNREWADWNVGSLLRLYNTTASSMPLFNSGSESLRAIDFVLISDGYRAVYVPRNAMYGGNAMISEVNMNILVEPRLKEARELYKTMLEQEKARLSESGSGDVYSPEIHEYQRALADISFIVKNKMELMADDVGEYVNSRLRAEPYADSARVVSSGYVASRDAFKAIVESLKTAPDSTPIDVALALLDLADWELLFDFVQRSEKLYEEAYSVLHVSGMTDAEIQAVTAPEAELPIPVYSVHQYSRQMQGLNRDSVVNYKGYVDIEYRLNRYGKHQSVKVLKLSEGTPPRLRRILLDHLKTQSVRPVISDGEIPKNTDVQLRYYYTY